MKDIKKYAIQLIVIILCLVLSLIHILSLGKMTDFIKKGDDPNTAWEKAKGQYGRCLLYTSRCV